jgi:arylsulfatase A-like enzyme
VSAPALRGAVAAAYAALAAGGLQLIALGGGVTGGDLPLVHAVGALAVVATAVAAAGTGALAGHLVRHAGAARAEAVLAGLAAGWAAGLSVMSLLQHGALPRIAPEALSGWAGAALAVPAGAAVFAVRYVSLRPGAGLASVLLDGPAAAVILLGLPVAAARLGKQPTSVKGMALWGACALGILAVVWLLERVPRTSPRRGPWGALGILTAAALVAAPAARVRIPPLPHRASGPPDILLVVLDTTRADSAPAPDGAWQATPALRRLASGGVRFTQAFSTSCWTLPAHGSLFTGLAPSEHGAVWATERLAPGVPTLAERFAGAGWRTAAFSANPWIHSESGFASGFERFVDADAGHRPRPPWQARLWPSALSRVPASLVFEDKGGLGLTAGVLRYLAREPDRPAFVFLNLMEPHLPYLPPARFLTGLEGSGWTHEALLQIDQDPLRDLLPEAARTPREIEGLRRLYAAEVAYADFLLGRILDALERSGRLDRTVVLVTSDHGENLGDHPPLDHQLGLWDTLIRVPLLLRYPAWSAGGVEAGRLVSLMDVPGALLHLAGIEEAGGGPLVEDDGREAVLVEYDRPGWILDRIRARFGLDPSPWDRDLQGVRTRGHKWIEATDGRHLAFDLVADPGERRNLAAEGAAPAEPFAELARVLAELRESLVAFVPEDEEASPLSEETRRKLRALGYLQ